MDKMTLKEKIALCEGKNFWETRDYPQYGVPSMFMCDGPHGLRKQTNAADHLGMNASLPATCFPSAVSTACSWDVELVGKIGAAIAAEAADQGVGVFLGPGVNIKRNPLCGRNFEYYSEDPVLAGKMAGSFVGHAQEKGIGACLKHFACNNQEYKRFNSDSILDERTLREIYLTPFEIAVREGRPKTVMCAYNKINGTYCSDNEELLTRILRDEWGFDGLVMTDWGAMNDRVAAFKAGCDLNMPGGSSYMEQDVMEAVARGELDEADIDRSVQRVKKMVLDAHEALKKKAACDYDTHHELARIAAEQSAVLLKNKENLLPLKENQKIALVGDMARNMRYQGAGSSHINPTRLIHPADVLKNSVPLEEADVAIVFAGLPPDYESEGFDRASMEMPPEHIQLIEDTAMRHPNTVVVLFCGAPVEMPWADKVKAILYMGLPGQAGGEAVKNLLYGIANPSGKLAETWPIHYRDCPSSAYYPQRDGQYREGIYVGYRYYDKAQVPVRWKFGFGLSYTEFSYNHAKLDDKTVCVTVTNTGSCAGAEIVQLYIALPQDGIHRPIRELKRFTKVYLEPGECREVRFELDDRCFAVWDNGWKVPTGTYTILVGGNPDELISAGSLQITGDILNIPVWQPESWYERPMGAPSQRQWEEMLGRKVAPYVLQKRKFTMNNTVMEMKKYSLVMQIMYLAVKRTISKGAKPGTPEYRMLLECSAGGPLRNLQISGGMKDYVFKGLLEMTDTAPKIAFALESDVEGEALKKAVLTVGNWRKETNDQINNVYDGPMKPFSRYTIEIEAEGTSGQVAKASASFESGRLDTPWRAQWITDLSYDFADKTSPVPLIFKRCFAIRGEVQRAWVNVTALGIYELNLNGSKVGKDYFAPGLTSYAHQIQYQTYDVTHQLKEINEVIAVVAGGWAVGSFNYRRKNKISADRQAFLCELHIEYANGTSEIIGTDEQWEVSREGNYRAAEWYDGEVYDATININHIKWQKAGITSPRGNPKLLAQYGPPVRVLGSLQPVSVHKAKSGELIYDFGQNFAGVISAKIKGKRGRTITFRHSEVLVEGELFVKSLRTAKATAVYTAIDGEQVYSPKLTYMGFRYVGVSGIDQKDLELSALVLHSEIEEIGTFSCSNPLINRLQENIRWGGKSNFVDIPTDCPQRDERQGWTGDIAVFASTACFNFDMSRFFDKWLMDMRAEQGRGGGIPMVVPRAGDTMPVMATACWGDSCVLVPWAEYLARGNVELLRKQYPAIKKFLKAAKWWSSFLSVTPNGRHIWRWPFHFGDWCAPDGSAREWIGRGKWVGTAYFANSCSIAAKIADILGLPEDARYYLDLRKKIIKAYREVFTDGHGKLKKEFQTAYILPLHFGMTEGAETKAMVENLVSLVRKEDNHLATGFPGTPYLLFALSDNGRLDVAYDLLLQDSCPSWLYQVKAGGTTIWERWDALRPDGTVNTTDLANPKDESSGGMVSFNHYAGGAVGDWLYRRVAGIEPTSGGYRTFRIKPMPGGGLSWAKASHRSPYGEIASSWMIEGNTFILQVCVPCGTRAHIVLPNQEEHHVESGTYTYRIKLETA